MNYFISLILALFLTIIIECFVALILRYRKKEIFQIIVLVNVLTNLTLNYLLLIFRLNNLSVFLYSIIVIFLEILIILIEWKIFVYVFGKNKEWFFLSIAINTTSYVLGGLIFILIT